MPETKANNLTLHYEEHGDPALPTILMIMGLGAQMTLWPPELVEALANRGFHVIRFDNRDIGLSEKLEGAKSPGILKMIIWDKLRLPLTSPYTLKDMADDAMGLLDALGIDKAHVVGASMGGMIAQHVALHHSERLLSLTSIMSTTGHRKLAKPGSKAIKALTTRPKSMETEVLIEHGVMVANALGGDGYTPDPERQRARVRENVERSVYPAGFVRQMAAIVADGSRREQLSQIATPTLVLHGEADPLIPVDHGEDTAAAIPGAVLKIVPGMGHDFPVEVIEEIADDIAEHARQAER